MPAFRLATMNDVTALEQLIADSVRGLGTADYSPKQIEAALTGAWGVDTDLIRDGTYFVVEAGGYFAGCGGWSRRRTLFGSDQGSTKDTRYLDPAREPARIRAFFVHPQWARRGIGRALLARCEAEAIAAGFIAAELVATLPGRRLYDACGYEATESFQHPLDGGLTIEFVRMRKRLLPE